MTEEIVDQRLLDEALTTTYADLRTKLEKLKKDFERIEQVIRQRKIDHNVL